jgi:hypothetical protein
MRHLLVFAVLPAILPGSPAADPIPDDGRGSPLLNLPGFEGYMADPYLDAAAKLQAMGKERAVAALADLAQKEMRTGGKRAILLCRMLFGARPGGEFRPPGLGGPGFAGDIRAEDWQTTCRDWPRMPLDVVDGVPFLVVPGYLLAGHPEPSSWYLDYCLRNCDWSDEVFQPRTAEQKRAALAKLVASPRWKRPLTLEQAKVLLSQLERGPVLGSVVRATGPRVMSGRLHLVPFLPPATEGEPASARPASQEH